MAVNDDVAYSADGSSSGVQNNGAVIVSVKQTGDYKAIAPEINAHLTSGTLYNRYNDRFDEHYGGPAS